MLVRLINYGVDLIWCEELWLRVLRDEAILFWIGARVMFRWWDDGDWDMKHLMLQLGGYCRRRQSAKRVNESILPRLRYHHPNWNATPSFFATFPPCAAANPVPSQLISISPGWMCTFSLSLSFFALSRIFVASASLGVRSVSHT